MPFSETNIHQEKTIKRTVEDIFDKKNTEDQTLDKFFQGHKMNQINISAEQIKKRVVELQNATPKLKSIQKETLEKYAKIQLYIDQLAQTKTRAEVTPDEKQFFLDFQSMNQSLGIDYQLPPFKESRETQSINTMADVYHHTDAIVQDKNA